MAIAISSIIPGWRDWSSCQPPARNGQPPQTKMTVPSTGPDPLDAVEVEVVAEPVHDHVAGHHDRDGQEQAPPEPAPEHLDVVAVPAVAAAWGCAHRGTPGHAVAWSWSGEGHRHDRLLRWARYRSAVDVVVVGSERRRCSRSRRRSPAAITPTVVRVGRWPSKARSYASFTRGRSSRSARYSPHRTTSRSDAPPSRRIDSMFSKHDLDLGLDRSVDDRGRRARGSDRTRR